MEVIPNQNLLKAMHINTTNSDDSMSGVTSTSRSTLGTIKWDKEVEGKELTSEMVYVNEREIFYEMLCEVQYKRG